MSLFGWLFGRKAIQASTLDDPYNVTIRWVEGGKALDDLFAERDRLRRNKKKFSHVQAQIDALEPGQ